MASSEVAVIAHTTTFSHGIAHQTW